MTPQIPAEGVLKQGDWGDAMAYKVTCSCSDPDHEHNVWVESNQYDISVIIYTTTKSNWNKNRFKHIWELLTKGYIEQEVAISFDRQTALNYANILTTAIDQLDKFKEKEKNGTS